MNSDEIIMEVNIAGERFSLSVPFSRQEAVRHTEAEISSLFRKFGETFPKKSPKEILAMVAYRFASSYFDLVEAREKDKKDALELLDMAARLSDENAEEIDVHPEDDFQLF